MSMEYIKENKNYYEEKINELNDKVKYYQNKTQRQDKEIKRLNNIIDKLEKWLKEYKIQCKKYDSNSTICIINCILNKLKELKEGR